MANLGLIFYMFLVGLELDVSQLRGRVGQAAAISNASVAFPMVLGMAAAVPTYALVAPDQEFVAFALFMGVAMSITAFPVLARILVERRMLKRPVGALTMAAAAIDDVTAWFLIAVALAVAVAGSATEVAQTILLAVAFCLLMFLAIRPLIARVSDAYDEAGRVPGSWIAAIFAGVLLSAFATETIGIALIFGAFVMGMVMPRHAELTEDVTGRIEDFVVILLLPLFFAYTGLRTNIGLLDRPELWLMTVALIGVAIGGKLLGAMLTARFTGIRVARFRRDRDTDEYPRPDRADRPQYRPREGGDLRGALRRPGDHGAGHDTHGRPDSAAARSAATSSAPRSSEELDEARRESETESPASRSPNARSCSRRSRRRAWAAPGTWRSHLRARTPPRELILPAWWPTARRRSGRTGRPSNREQAASRGDGRDQEARDELIERGIAARAVAFISSDPGDDLSHIA